MKPIELIGKINGIPGWYNPKILNLVHGINEWHLAEGIQGGVAEIGVYCGRSFVGLASCCHDGEKALAIDVFDKQEWNESMSGAGHVDNMSERFDETIRKFGVDGHTIKVPQSSMELTPQDVSEMLNGGPRIFRVDGGHSYEEALRDLWIAHFSVCKNGVILVDDVFSPGWPSVGAAVNKWIEDRLLVPVFIYHGEVVLCRDEDYAAVKYGTWKRVSKHHVRPWKEWDVAIWMSEYEQRQNKESGPTHIPVTG